ncbi:MAG: sodium:solute symporter family protein [Sciscionella sp.]
MKVDVSSEKVAPSRWQDSKLARILPFAVIVIGTVIYVVIAGNHVSWPGLAAMLVFYAFFYWLGAFVAAKKGKGGLEDTVVAGRRLPLWICAFTMTAVWVGGGYISGTAQETYADGLAWAQAPWGYALSLIIGGLVFAPTMRRNKFMTMLDPIDLRFGRRMAGISAIPAVLGEVFWSGAILTALGTLFGTIVGLGFQASIITSVVIVIIYTVVGGAWSVAFTDTAQIIIIFVGLAVIVPFMFSASGGFGAALHSYNAKFPSTNSLFPPLAGWRDPAWGDAYWNWWDSALLLIFGGIPWQVYFQRVLSARSPNAARWMSVAAGLIAAAAAVFPVLMGIAATHINFTSLGAPPLTNPSFVLPYVLRYAVPFGIAVVGLGAVASAVMSSTDASFLSASSLGGWNIYRRLIKPTASAEQVTKMIRKLIVVVGVAATLLALNIKSVYTLWYLSSDLIYCLLFPMLVCSLFVPFANRSGAVAGFCVALVLRLGGGAPVFGLPMFLPYPMVHDGVSDFPFRTLAMSAGLLTIILVSLATRRFDPPKALRVLRPGSPERQLQATLISDETPQPASEVTR